MAWKSLTLSQVTLAFVAFALLLSAALLGAEATTDLGLSRTMYTIWATTVLVTPALCAFALPGRSQTKANYWLLFWTVAFLAYAVHVYYAVFVEYHGSMAELLEGQGTFPAAINLIFTVWWAFDLVLAWAYADAAWIRIQRIAGHWFIGLTFVASTVFLKHGFINAIGLVLTVTVAVCLVLRLRARRAAVPATAATSSTGAEGAPAPVDAEDAIGLRQGA
jgi:hypothetical protein